MGRILVIEKHKVETSGSKHQIQVPQAAFRRFFAGQNATLSARVFPSAQATTPAAHLASIRAYTNSTTRINRITSLGYIGHALVFIEELTQPTLHYDIWWYPDPIALSIISAWRGNWKQARKSQHGPGRKWTIISGVSIRVSGPLSAGKITHI
jgi:hypothetical protein